MTLREATKALLATLDAAMVDNDFGHTVIFSDDVPDVLDAMEAVKAALVMTEDKPDGCDYDDCINYDENELCYRWSSGDCPGPRMPK